MRTDKAIIDLNDQELEEVVRNGNDNLKREQARKERDYRSQKKSTEALNRWTFIIAAATLVNAIATCVLVLRVLGAL